MPPTARTTMFYRAFTIIALLPGEIRESENNIQTTEWTSRARAGPRSTSIEIAVETE